MSTKTYNISETVQDRTKGYNDELIGTRIRAFDCYQNQWPWMTLNGQNALL